MDNLFLNMEIDYGMSSSISSLVWNKILILPGGLAIILCHARATHESNSWFIFHD